MLEDGEIGEDDFTITPPNETPTTTAITSPNHTNEINNQKSKSSSASSKRNKTRESDSTKRHKKRHHHHKSSSSKRGADGEDEDGENDEDLNDEELNDAYNPNLDDNEFNDDDNLFNSKNDYDSRLDTNNSSSNTADSIFNLAGGDRDERDNFNLNINKSNSNSSSKPKYPSLMSTTVTSSWSTPMSKKDITKQPQQQQQQQPKSLLDLFLTTGPSISAKTNSEIIDPVLTEKENKPNKFSNKTQIKPNQLNRPQNQNFNNNNKRKSEEDAEEKLISTESLEKKLEKKRKYVEQAKEKQKAKELKQQQALLQPKEPIVCKFFQEGRCQKGADCPFSHNTQVNKKYEVCKYYLNGYCAKEEKCLYMHSEFPCKFFHRKNYQTGLKMNQCLHGDACRFSHQAITNPLLLEAFEKHLNETENNDSKSAINTNSNIINKTSLLGSPPQQSQSTEIPSLMNISIKTPSATGSTVKTSSLSPPSSPPQPLLTQANNLVNPLMSRLNSNEPNNNKKQPLLATPPQPLLNCNQTSLMSNPLINPLMGTARPLQKTIPINANLNKPVSLFNDQDVDERAILTNSTKPSTLMSTNIPLNLVNNTNKILPSNDVDERSIIMPTKSLTPEEPPKDIKQELIIKIMKSLADESGGVFAQIPKQTLTELLVKLLNSSSDSKSDGTDVIINLLTSLSATSVANKPFDFGAATNDDDKSAHLNESSSNLLIDLSHNNTMNKTKTYDDYDDDDDDDYDLIIEGQIDDMPYKLIELDVEPSKLWHDPPQNTQSNDPLAVDQESDPRIKYYNNLDNISNVANFQQKLIEQEKQQQQQAQQQQIQTPTSPSSSSNVASINTLVNLLNASASSPSGQTDSTTVLKQATNTKQQTNRIADPRLLRSQNVNTSNNLSPTRSVSPLSHEQLFGKGLPQNDLISLQNRTVSSLLPSLPDLQLPSVYQLKQVSQQQQQQHQQTQQQSSESNTVKLSIEDYKRKLQRPTSNTTSSTNVNKSITSSILSSINSNDYQANATSAQSVSSNSTNTPSLPSIPSYLQAPQSLHELLRNFQS